MDGETAVGWASRNGPRGPRVITLQSPPLGRRLSLAEAHKEAAVTLMFGLMNSFGGS